MVLKHFRPQFCVCMSVCIPTLNPILAQKWTCTEATRPQSPDNIKASLQINRKSNSHDWLSQIYSASNIDRSPHGGAARSRSCALCVIGTSSWHTDTALPTSLMLQEQTYFQQRWCLPLRRQASRLVICLALPSVRRRTCWAHAPASYPSTTRAQLRASTLTLQIKRCPRISIVCW